MRFAPAEESSIADQSGLDDFGIARPEFPRRQRGQGERIGQHHARLVKSAEQVLAEGGVDACFAADAGIDLGQERGGDLYKRQPTQDRRRREARKVADNAAAKGNDGGAPFDPRLQQGVGDVAVCGERLGALTG